jgi:DNA-binding NarL/FixJ family response regulator
MQAICRSNKYDERDNRSERKMQLRYMADARGASWQGAKPDMAGTPRALSSREREILELVARGLTGSEIAERLVISIETVRTHIRNSKRKLGARTQAHALIRALEHGEIALPPSHRAA